MRTCALLPARLLVFASGAAHAGYVEADYSGSILAGDWVGATVTYQVVYDPSTLQDHTASIDALTGLNFSQVLTASLSDDPNASLSITFSGPVNTSFSKPGRIQPSARFLYPLPAYV